MNKMSKWIIMISVNYSKINCIVIRENKIQLLPHHTSKKMNHNAKYENLEIVSDGVCAYEQDPGFHP